MAQRGGRDYKEIRDDYRFERKYDLTRRREGGKALDGVQSEAQIAIASDSGLAETETIAESAVSAVTIIEDSGLEDHSGDAHDSYVLLTETEITGRGYPVAVQFTDEVPWNSSGVDIYISYRLQIIDPDGVVQATHEQKVITISSFGWDVWTHPDITVVADLRDGVTYRAQVHFFQNTGMGTFSAFRRFVITDLKR